jgi:hypothetical protein
MLQYSQRHSMINHCDRRITHLSDNVIMIYLLVCLIYLLFLYAFWVIVSNTLNAKEILKIYLIEQKIYTNHQDEWYILSQWFIMLCLWLYCISITKMRDTSYHSDLSCYVSDCTVSVSPRWVIHLITVIYHAMSLTVLYMFILCIELHCTSACPVREIKWVWNFNCLGLLYLTPLSTIFQLYRARGAQFYWWMRLEYLEKTSDL